MKANIVSCARCLYDETTPGISFDGGGVCNYCAMHDNLNREYPIGVEGEKRLKALADEIRASGKGKRYDCVVGVSGGCNSSYLLVKMVELGLRPLAAHFDNTWNSPIATQNIYNLLKRLNVDLFTIVVNNKEYDDIYRSFMLAGLKEVDAATDIGLAATLYRACEKHDIKYIIEGHSFRTEGVSRWAGPTLTESISKASTRSTESCRSRLFPIYRCSTFCAGPRSAILKRSARSISLIIIEEEAKKFSPIIMAGNGTVGITLRTVLPRSVTLIFTHVGFQSDMRTLGYSALIRSGQMKREEGVTLMTQSPQLDPEILDMVKQRLGFSDGEFERVMTRPFS